MSPGRSANRSGVFLFRGPWLNPRKFIGGSGRPEQTAICQLDWFQAKIMTVDAKITPNGIAFHSKECGKLIGGNVLLIGLFHFITHEVLAPLIINGSQLVMGDI